MATNPKAVHRPTKNLNIHQTTYDDKHVNHNNHYYNKRRNNTTRHDTEHTHTHTTAHS